MKSRFSRVHRQDLVDKSHQCLHTNQGIIGLKYLTESRGLSMNTINKFKLGYIPLHVPHALSGRILIPIYDSSNNLVVVSSRSIHKNSSLPKYWHEKYEKSMFLYGSNIASEYMRKWNVAVLCEGQFDVLQLHDKGMYNAVAVCGKALSDIQLSIIHRYCNELILVFDTDNNMSGQRAMMCIMHPGLKKVDIFKMSKSELRESLNKKREYKFYDNRMSSLVFDYDTDPDDFVRKNGINEFKLMLKKRVREMREC